MKNLGARWTITEKPEGKIVMYENLETGIAFNCGMSPPGTDLFLILEFILSEGDPGDLVFVNGQFYTQTCKEICA